MANPPRLAEHRPRRSLWRMGWLTGAWCVLLAVWLLIVWLGGVSFFTAMPSIVLVQTCVALLVIAALWLAARRASASVATALALALVSPLVVFNRAPIEAEPGPDRTLLRVMVANTNTTNGNPDEIESIIRGSDADVMLMLELPLRTYRGLRRGTLEQPFEVVWTSPPGQGYAAVLSRVPMEINRPGTESASEVWQRDWYITARASIDGQPFILLACHPPSPRSPGRWRQGAAGLRAAAGVANELREDPGAPLVVLGDFNSTHAGQRRRILYSALGVRDTKPLFRWGSWPASSDAPWRLDLDAVLIGGEVRLHAWDHVSVPGSDHLAVKTTLSLPSIR